MEVCIVCDILDEGVFCCFGVGCIFWFYGECLNFNVGSGEDFVKIYCFYCWFRVLMMKDKLVREKCVVAEKEVFKCLSKDYLVDGIDVVRD